MTSHKRIAPRDICRLVAGGFAAGVVNGIFGNGGGVVVVFLFSGLWAIFSDRREVFANVTASVLPIALTSAMIYSSLTPPDPADVLRVGISSLAGGVVGAILLGRIDPRALKTVFAVLMVVSGIMMIVWGK